MGTEDLLDYEKTEMSNQIWLNELKIARHKLADFEVKKNELNMIEQSWEMEVGYQNFKREFQMLEHSISALQDSIQVLRYSRNNFLKKDSCKIDEDFQALYEEIKTEMSVFQRVFQKVQIDFYDFLVSWM